MSRSGGGNQEDQKIRTLNSGIKNDKRIIYDTNFNAGSFSASMKDKHGLNQLLFDEEITAQRRETLNYSDKKIIRELHISKGCCGKTMDNCSSMLCGAS
jgi:hypothetical protein